MLELILLSLLCLTAIPLFIYDLITSKILNDKKSKKIKDIIFYVLISIIIISKLLEKIILYNILQHKIHIE
jgi:hypothetical protein